MNEFTVWLKGRKPHRGTITSGNKATGYATVRAVSIKQAYYFVYQWKFSNNDYSPGIVSIDASQGSGTTYKFDYTEEELSR